MNRRITTANRCSIIIITLLLHCAVWFIVHPIHVIATTVPIRINIGNDNDMITDSNGNVWGFDQYFTTGNPNYSCPKQIASTTLDNIYCSYRWFNQNNVPYQYVIPQVTNGEYIIILHFAELYFKAANRRVFDVYIEGSLVANDYDIYAAAGGFADKATTIQVNMNVTDNNGVTIELVRVIENPAINAIEIIPYTGQPLPTMVPTVAPVTVPVPVVGVGDVVARVNCGGDEYIDTLGHIWSADQFIVNNYGQGYASCPRAIAVTVEDTLYCTNRWFATWNGSPYIYEVPVSAVGVYEVRLYFAEIYFDDIGRRVFDVLVENIFIRKNLDIVQVTGNIDIAYIITVPVSVTDGKVTIEFRPIVENPFISAFEIIRLENTSPVATPPTSAPVAPTPFQTILINCGGDEYLDNAGVRTWKADQYFTGGFTYSSTAVEITGTLDDTIFHSERWGEFIYNIPVPNGQYEIVIHLAEIYHMNPGTRVFDLTIEDEIFYSVDINLIADGRYKAVTLQSAQVIDDGFVTIAGTKNVTTSVDNPKISGIEIRLLAPHTAHAVGGGPYVRVDATNQGYAIVPVDGTASHTHGPGLTLNQWIWKEGATILGNGQTANLNLSVGEHSVVLTVIDSGGNDSAETFTVSVLPYGYPAILSLSPSSGFAVGNQLITISGSGFNFTAAEIVVQFGLVNLTGSSIQVVNSTTITLLSPPVPIATPVLVLVTTPIGTSDKVTFTYEASAPIQFTSDKLIDFPTVTVATFGPDEKLYVGTLYGNIAKLTLNADFTAVTGMVVSTVTQYKAILGIAFDPMDVDIANPPVFITSSYFFHGEGNSTFGEAINGKVHRVSGANLDVVETVISGLPVSDSDHGVNGITFGNNGELYIQIGSNTNGGVPGPLTTRQIQKDNYFSASTVVAYMADPLFNGFITYDAIDNGTPNGGYGVEVFAPGSRNPFGIVMHSNGRLYGTDNGSNLPYGNMMTGCGSGEFVTAVETEDKINLLQQGKYYGQPNAKRAAVHNDSRQCVWRNPATTTTSLDYEAPLVIVKSSTDGIIEYEADHFDGQLRGNLIVSKYTDGLSRVILTPDGLGVVPESVQALPLVGDWGLCVTQAPNGDLIEIRLPTNSIQYHKPIEAATSQIKVASVFPRRGPNTGGSNLFIYGRNFNTGSNLAVNVGGSNCEISSSSAAKITCTLPGGVNGLVDVVVSSSVGTYTYQKGYRYISGF